MTSVYRGPSRTHGWGLFTKQDVRKGESILVEEPLISCSAADSSTSTSLTWKLTELVLGRGQELTGFLTDNFAPLPENGLHWSNSDARELKRLSSRVYDGGQRWSRKFIRRLYAIISSVNMTVVPAAEDTTCIYEMASNLNHACTPNAMPRYEGRTLRLLAIKDIPKDTEVTIPFVCAVVRGSGSDGDESSSMSFNKADLIKDMLWERFGFRCRCPDHHSI